MDDIAFEIADEAPDPATARAEWRLALLEELTEIGMSLARGLRDELAGIAAGEKPARDPAEVFARVSRAVRLTLALHAKADQELRDLKAGVMREREEKRVKATERDQEAARKVSEARVRKACDLVEAICDAEASDYEDFYGLREALEERLGEDFAYQDCDQWPLRETVERLCRDLGLNPDWSHWTGEGWDEHYTFERNRWDPLNLPNRRPVATVYEPPDCDPPPPETRSAPRQLE